MSETDHAFEIEVNDEITLSRDSTVEHAEHGPMIVDSIAIGTHTKTASFKSQTSPIGLELTEAQIRERWGETMHTDPFKLHEVGSARFQSTAISAEGSDIEVEISVEGPEADAETVYMHAIDQIAKGLQAVRDEKPPSECMGGDFEIDWETRFGKGGDA